MIVGPIQLDEIPDVVSKVIKASYTEEGSTWLPVQAEHRATLVNMTYELLKEQMLSNVQNVSPDVVPE